MYSQTSGELVGIWVGHINMHGANKEVRANNDAASRGSMTYITVYIYERPQRRVLDMNTEDITPLHAAQ